MERWSVARESTRVIGSGSGQKNQKQWPFVTTCKQCKRLQRMSMEAWTQYPVNWRHRMAHCLPRERTNSHYRPNERGSAQMTRNNFSCYHRRRWWSAPSHQQPHKSGIKLLRCNKSLGIYGISAFSLEAWQNAGILDKGCRRVALYSIPPWNLYCHLILRSVMNNMPQ